MLASAVVAIVAFPDGGAASPSSASGSILISSGFEEGSFANGSWTLDLKGTDSSAKIVTSPVFSGRHAARFATASQSDGERAFAERGFAWPSTNAVTAQAMVRLEVDAIQFSSEVFSLRTKGPGNWVSRAGFVVYANTFGVVYTTQDGQTKLVQLTDRPYTNGGWYELSLVVDYRGQSPALRFLIDGQEAHSFTDTASGVHTDQPQTVRVGFGPGSWGTNAGSVFVDDVRILDLGAPASPTPTVSATPTPTRTPAAAATNTAVPSTATPQSTTAPSECQALHDSYKAMGPDGQEYATWHPASATLSNGTVCHFGHEHGDNSSGSPALNGRPVLFGYAAAQVGIGEPHPGFKVFRWDNIVHPNAPNHTGASVVMTLHQGTSGAARFTTVHHDMSFHYRNPNDGREVHVHQLAPFGALLVGCGANDPAPALKLQQASVPGMRQVSADKCFNLPSVPYEDWITALYVGTDGNGNWMAYMDPHFAIFNPNTYCIVANNACTLGYSDARAGTGANPQSTASLFKGDKREAYLNQVWIKNRSDSTTVWTDAYGRRVAEGATGAIPQYIAQMYTEIQGNSAAFGAANIHDDGSVHAPN